MDRSPKPYVAFGAVVLLVGLLPPLLKRDSFPLSTYPMFSSRRSSTESVDTAVFVDGAGRIIRLDPDVIAGIDEPILATQTVRNAISQGHTAQLCDEIAGRFGSTESGHIEIVSEVFDSLSWYDGDKFAVRRTVHQRCLLEQP